MRKKIREFPSFLENLSLKYYCWLALFGQETNTVKNNDERRGGCARGGVPGNGKKTKEAVVFNNDTHTHVLYVVVLWFSSTQPVSVGAKF